MSKVIEKFAQIDRPIPSPADYDLPEPPVAPCTPEEYDQWFRAKVQEALDDPRPSIPHEQVMAEVRALIKNKRRAVS